ncbi:MAG TPA: hypothetical protein VKE71_14915 [Candidatus Angelobacter sp.]|nr:hypothetical protein [Candidatus Angelobacter sp.]
MSRKLQCGLLFVCLSVLSTFGWADTLKLKNGSTIIGKYAGGSENQISFRVGTSVQSYYVSDVASLTFDSSTTSRYTDDPGFASRNSQPPSTQSDPTYRSYSNSITVPAGTRLVVRTIDPIDSDKNHVGDKFEALLEQPLNVNDIVVAPKGASVYGRLEEVKEAGHISGKSELKLALTGIVINGQTVALSTSDYELSGKSRGANTAKKVGGGAAAGAVIGAIVGGGKGAAIGAGVGAGAGTAVQVLTRGQQVHVPSETLLEFTLDQSVTVSRAQ